MKNKDNTKMTDEQIVWEIIHTQKHIMKLLRQEQITDEDGLALSNALFELQDVGKRHGTNLEIIELQK